MTAKWDAFHGAPVRWDALRQAMVCTICGARFAASPKPGDKGSFPKRNRARGKAIRHANAEHAAAGKKAGAL